MKHVRRDDSDDGEYWRAPGSNPYSTRWPSKPAGRWSSGWEVPKPGHSRQTVASNAHAVDMIDTTHAAPTARHAEGPFESGFGGGAGGTPGR